MGLLLPLLPASPVPLPAQSYQSGGTFPFADEVQHLLDRNAAMISLGFNADWLAEAEIDPLPYARAIDATAEAVREGHLPGAVLHVFRMSSEAMPVAVGHRITDPEHRRAHFDTRYYLEDLGAPLSTIPLLLLHCQERSISLDMPLSLIFEQWSAEDRREVTIGMVLRHASGLPASWAAPSEALEGRGAILGYINDLGLASEPGTQVEISRLNHLLAGLILEKLKERYYSEIFREGIVDRFQLSVTSLGIDPSQRQLLAPGAYSDRWGHLLWGETDEPVVQSLGLDTSYAGMVSTADEVAAIAYVLLFQALSAPPLAESEQLPAVYRGFRPDASVKGGESMGLGYQLGRFGEGSFGWDSPHGSSFWALPGQMAVIVFLSNQDHPGGVGSGEGDPREIVLPLLANAAGWDDADPPGEETTTHEDGN